MVDGRISLTGGMNLASPYMGPPALGPFWRDFAAVVEGPIVADLEALFASDWGFATGSEPGSAPERAEAREPARRAATPKSSPAAPMSPAIRFMSRCSR